MEGQIDKKILTLARQDDTSAEKQIASRQLTVKNEKSSSWFLECQSDTSKILPW